MLTTPGSDTFVYFLNRMEGRVLDGHSGQNVLLGRSHPDLT